MKLLTQIYYLKYYALLTLFWPHISISEFVYSTVYRGSSRLYADD